MREKKSRFYSVFFSGLEGSKCFVHGWDGAVGRDVVEAFSPLFRKISFLCVCFESHELSSPAYLLAGEAFWRIPLFPLPVPSLTFPGTSSTSVVSGSFCLSWIPAAETQRGLELVFILVSILISDLGGGHYMQKRKPTRETFSTSWCSFLLLSKSE